MIGGSLDDVPTLISDRRQDGKGSGQSRCTVCGDEWQSGTYWHCGRPGCHQTVVNDIGVIDAHPCGRRAAA